MGLVNIVLSMFSECLNTNLFSNSFKNSLILKLRDVFVKHASNKISKHLEKFGYCHEVIAKGKGHLFYLKKKKKSK